MLMNEWLILQGKTVAASYEACHWFIWPIHVYKICFSTATGSIGRSTNRRRSGNSLKPFGSDSRLFSDFIRPAGYGSPYGYFTDTN